MENALKLNAIFNKLDSSMQLRLFKDRIKLQTNAFVHHNTTKDQLLYYVNRKNLKFANEDILDYAQDSLICEIYTADDIIQSFANRTFFNFSNYDIISLITKPFYELYERDLKYTQQILDHVTKVIKLKNTIPYEIEPHILYEIAHKNKGKYEIELKYISPLLDSNGDVVEVISLNKCTKIN